MGNTSAEEYRKLVYEYSDTVTRLCLVHTGNMADAEDCYQNVFLKLFKALEKGEVPNPKAWLIKVTLNECRSLLRYRLRHTTLDIDELTTGREDKTDLELIDMIFRLPPKYRDVIYLYYYEEMSVEEIAAAAKIKASTVKTQLSRGREKLKGLLTD